MTLGWGIIAGVVASAMTASPLVAQAVIIRATGPDAARFPVGQVLAKGTAIALQRGSILGLIDKAGAWELRGLVKTKIGKRPVETASRLQLMQELVKKRKRIKRLAAVAALPVSVGATGVMRGSPSASAARKRPPVASAPPAPTSPRVQGIITGPPTRNAQPLAREADRIESAWWQYPLGESGTFCLVTGQPFELARRSGPEQDVLFRDTTGSKVLTYRFGTEAEIGHAATSDMPVTDGRFYTVEAGGGAKAKVRFVPISAPTDPIALTRSLVANGCTRQIDALSRETAMAGSAAEPARP